MNETKDTLFKSQRFIHTGLQPGELGRQRNDGNRFNGFLLTSSLLHRN